MQFKKKQLEPDMEQQTGSKWQKEYVKAIYCHPAYLTYMQNTSCEMPGWMKHKLESRLLWEISITSDMQMTPHLCRKQRGIKEPLDEGERGEWKSWLKITHSGPPQPPHAPAALGERAGLGDAHAMRADRSGPRPVRPGAPQFGQPCSSPWRYGPGGRLRRPLGKTYKKSA